MGDPRTANCQRFDMANGLVTSVELRHFPVPSGKYELITAELIDEETAQGQIVARVLVMDRNNVPAQVNCYLAWPWQGWQHPAQFENKALPGNSNYPYQHMITNAYDPPQLGPLAIFIGDREGNVQSDVIAGLGLPGRRHVGYHLVFRERTAAGDGGGDDGSGGGDAGGDGGATGDLAALTAQLQRIEAKLDRLSRHFGVGER